jgi:plasmid maintenance system antidote protein VapI
MVRTKQKNVRLVAVMAEKCLSGRDLARQVHVHRNTISAILNVRQDPTAETARAIADALGVSPVEIGFDKGADL